MGRYLGENNVKMYVDRLEMVFNTGKIELKGGSVG